jgi:putative transposase
MARKPRLEFGGAIYHIISRGNYRKALFEQRGEAASFEKTVFEACGKCGWILHAYVVMSNHYHLALETPEGNLVDGMRWLQGTFGIRFNAFHRERGHVFQSRYKSLLVEEGRPLLGLVNYIHLNPVRAGITALDQLRDYPWSSYPKFFEPRPPRYLVRKRFLASLEFPDSVSGMREYERHLEFAQESHPGMQDELARRYCQGWAIGSAEYRKDLRKSFADCEESAGWGGAEVQELREEKWERVFSALMRAAGKSPDDAPKTSKSAPWKIEAARALRQSTTASNAWIAARLVMGHPSRVCNLIRKKV